MEFAEYVKIQECGYSVTATHFLAMEKIIGSNPIIRFDFDSYTISLL